MPASTSTYPWASPKHRNTVHWVVAIAAIALVFDGYDLVVYGTVLPILMEDPSHLGAVSAAQAGALGSYALVGVMVGALVTGALGDHLGRRKMMLVNIAWFSIGMALFIAFTHRGNLQRLWQGKESRFERARLLYRLHGRSRY